MMADLLAQLRRPSVTSPPPRPGQTTRNDLAVLAVVAFTLVLGLGIRYQALNASKRFPLAAGLPTLRYPANWITGQPGTLHFQAINPASVSTFDAQVHVLLRDRRADETLDLARAAWGIRRSDELNQYRELTAEPVTVLGGQAALLTTYAYVADPTRASGATGLPVVVQGQDLIFLHEGKWFVVTVAADATQWAAEQRHFNLIFASLALQPLVTAVLIPAPVTPAATPASTPTATAAKGSAE
jgi:hypothetical protein